MKKLLVIHLITILCFGHTNAWSMEKKPKSTHKKHGGRNNDGKRRDRKGKPRPHKDAGERGESSYQGRQRSSQRKKLQKGRTPLMVAILQGDKAEVNKLLANITPEELDRTDEYGMTALHYAAQKNPALLAALLKAKARFDIQDTTYGNTPLHAAAWAMQQKSMSLLIAAGAALEALNKEKRTPLHCVTSNKKESTNEDQQRACVLLLLKAGALYNSLDGQESTPASYLPSGSPVKALLKCITQVRDAAQEGQLPTMVSLLGEEDIPLDARDCTTLQTALHRAYMYGHRAVASQLEALGADTTLKDRYGLTPTDYQSGVWALWKNFLECPFQHKEEYAGALEDLYDVDEAQRMKDLLLLHAVQQFLRRPWDRHDKQGSTHFSDIIAKLLAVGANPKARIKGEDKVTDIIRNSTSIHLQDMLETHLHPPSFVSRNAFDLLGNDE